MTTYTLTYDSNGAIGGGPLPVDSQTYNAGDTVYVANLYEYTLEGVWTQRGFIKPFYELPAGSSFTTGWTQVQDTLPDVATTFTMPAHDVTLYIYWVPAPYTVSYDFSSSTLGPLTSGSSLWTPNEWYKSGDQAYQIRVENFWPFNHASGVVGEYGTVAIRSGYLVAEWRTAPDGGGIVVDPNYLIPISGDVTLYSHWGQAVGIIYDANGADGGALPPYAPALGTTATLCSIFSFGSLYKTGYSFQGWCETPDGTGSTYMPSMSYVGVPTSGSDITLYAKWVMSPTPTATATPTTTPTPTPSTSIAPTPTYRPIPTATATPSGVTPTPSSSHGATPTPSPGVTQTPTPTSLGVFNHVTYVYDNIVDIGITAQGTLPVDSTAYAYGSTVTVMGQGTTSITSTNYIYTFVGWNTLRAGSGGTSYAPGSTFAISGNTNLYTVWTYVVNPSSYYTLTYNGNGYTSGTVPLDDYQGNGIQSHYGPGGVSTNPLKGAGTMVKTGFTLDHWNTQADGLGTSYAIGAEVVTTANFTLYAIWVPTLYPVTYLGNTNNTGTVPTGGSFHTGDTVTVADNTGGMTKIGEIFGGWNTVSDGTGTSYAAGDTFAMPTHSVSLYAIWMIPPTHIKFYAIWEPLFKIEYYPNGATSGSPPTDGNTYEPASLATILGKGNLVKTKAVFKGWNTKADGTGTFYSPGSGLIVP